jgi:hypothetical protein
MKFRDNRLLFFAAIASGLLLAYQNCGEFGGPGIGGVLPSQNCSAEGVCDLSSIGDPSSLKINITSGTALGTDLREVIVPVAEPSVSVSGSCSNGGFNKTAIDWKLSQGIVERAHGRSTGCSDTGEFTLSTTFAPNSLTAGITYTFETRILALDQFDNEIPGRNPSRVNVRPLQVLLAPVLDSRACGGGANWQLATNNFVHSVSSLAPSIFIGDAPLPRICGYCEVRTGEAGKPVDINLYQVGLVPGQIGRTSKYSGLATCARLPAGQSAPADLKGVYNGKFEVLVGSNIPVNLQLNTSEPDYGGWHARIYASLNDSLAGVDYERSSKDSQPIEIHFKFKVNDSGRDWTVPLARATLRRLKSAVGFAPEPDSLTIDGHARALYSALKKSTPLGANALPLRNFLITNFMKGTESVKAVQVAPLASPIPQVVLDGMRIDDEGSYANLLYKVASGQRNCDNAIPNNMAGRIPDFGYPSATSAAETHGDINSRGAQISRIAVCTIYWFARGFLGRRADSLQDVLKEGMKYDSTRVDGSNNPIHCRSFTGNKNIEFCDFIERYYDFYLEMADRFLPGQSIVDGPRANVEKFYAAIAQFYLNWIIGSDMCDYDIRPRGLPYSEPNEFYQNMIDLVFPLNKTMGMSNLSGLLVHEDNGFGAEFAAYSQAGGEVCGSGNAEGSRRILKSP